MKITTKTMLSIASLALIFLVYGSTTSSASGNLTTNAVSNTPLLKNKCDITAFIKTNSSGLNVRDSATKEGGIIETIPFDKEGTLVRIIADSGDGSGWLQINKAETIRTKSVFSGKGWVFSDFLAITLIGDSGRVKLYESDNSSEVLTTIPVNTEVKLFGCEGKRALVNYKDLYGWIEPENQCGSPAVLCM